jgi:enoyl-CoA hydratase
VQLKAKEPVPEFLAAVRLAAATMRHGRWPRACEAEVEMTGAEAHYDNILVERRGAVGLVTLNRPQALNALSAALIADLGAAFDDLEADPGIAAIVLTGGEKAFAAGADIKEMAGKSYMQAYTEDFITRGWERVAQCRKPVVAAVGGFALGGGCEVAMMCDIIIAAENARFGQPEINLGTMPGAGGTQRLPRFIGKAKAMDLCLTGRMMDAAEAERAGLVSRVVPADKLLEEALAIANRIAELSQPIAMMVKESVNRAFETTLAEGVRFERRLFHSTFATEDQKEGMSAFIEKRKPAFRNR